MSGQRGADVRHAACGAWRMVCIAHRARIVVEEPEGPKHELRRNRLAAPNGPHDQIVGKRVRRVQVQLFALARHLVRLGLGLGWVKVRVG